MNHVRVKRSHIAINLILTICIGALIYVLNNQEKRDLLTSPLPETVVPPTLDKLAPLAIIDLSHIVFALEEYKRKNDYYPISSKEGSGWDGLYSSWGQSREDWITDLMPAYISKLPRDRRENDIPHEQYVYRSNGANYMLLSYNPTDCSEILKYNSNFVPKNRYCWAYGFWTKGAINW